MGEMPRDMERGRNDSVINDLFSSSVSLTLICSDCDTTSITVHWSMLISLDIPLEKIVSTDPEVESNRNGHYIEDIKEVTLEHCLREMDAWYYDQCKQHQRATKNIRNLHCARYPHPASHPMSQPKGPRCAGYFFHRRSRPVWQGGTE